MYNTFLKQHKKQLTITNIRVRFLEKQQANPVNDNFLSRTFFFLIFIYFSSIESHPFIYWYVYIGIKVTCNLAHVSFQLQDNQPWGSYFSNIDIRGGQNQSVKLPQ